MQKLTSENEKLKYRITHLIRALNEADLKLAASKGTNMLELELLLSVYYIAAVFHSQDIAVQFLLLKTEIHKIQKST
jgi:hypothetical protein